METISNFTETLSSEESRREALRSELLSILNTVVENGVQDKKRYFSFTLGEPGAVQADMEFYPDILRGGHKMVIEKLTVFKGDKDYQAGVELIASVVRTLKEAGINTAIKTDDFSDEEELVADITKAATPREGESLAA